MSLTLGQKLRQAREERGISISEVAEQTRISPHYIESIENDDYKTLPGGIFNKGFIKSYARYVGFNEQEALSDYTKMMSQSPEGPTDEPKVYRPEVLTDDRYSASRWPSLLLAAVILSLMTAGVLYLVNYIQNRSEPSPVANSVTPMPPVATAPPGGENAAAPAGAEVPTMGSVQVQFASSREVSLASTVDGSRSESLVRPDKPVEFQPKESLLLRFYGPLASAVDLKINGKDIALPTDPPVRGVLAININAETLPRIWESGRVESEAPRPTGRPSANREPSTTRPQRQTPAAAPVRPAALPSPSPRR